MYDVEMTDEADDDYKKFKSTNLTSKIAKILITVAKNPYEKSQGFERLKHNLRGMCSRHINMKHRFVYTVVPNTKNLRDDDGTLFEGIVRVISMRNHYGDK
jgi:Txe/YoeB family toxin of toxin-antitoxin system